MSKRMSQAYLAGCLNGDAWFSSPQKSSPNGYLCLRCADEDFATAFSNAITAGFCVPSRVTVDERGYYLVRKNNGFGRFELLREFEPYSQPEMGVWLRGLFDSEGSVKLSPKPASGPRSWDRRIGMFVTDEAILIRASEMLAALGIDSRIRDWKAGTGHKGTKPVYALLLNSSQTNYSRFADLVGSSIARKREALERIPQTYVNAPVMEVQP